jgi:molecular chaperone HtpG
MPLNVSRSYLQQDAYVQKISKHIVKKIAEKLGSLFKNNRSDYEKYWADIHPFIKYGMMQDTDFYDKTKDYLLLDTTKGEKRTLQEYLDKNKTEKVVYTNDKETQASYISLYEKQGSDVVIFNHYIDTHFIQFLESKDTKIKYQSVENVLSEDTEDTTTTLDNDLVISLFKEALGNETLKVEVKALKTEEVPAMMVEAEFSKRMKTMSIMMKSDFAFPADETLIVNQKNPLITKIETLAKQDKKEDAKLLAHHLYDLALLSQKPLTGEQIKGLLERSQHLLSKIN